MRQKLGVSALTEPSLKVEIRNGERDGPAARNKPPR
jgi:hypothetical protein